MSEPYEGLRADRVGFTREQLEDRHATDAGGRL
jgi:hypothetical protein